MKINTVAPIVLCLLCSCSKSEQEPEPMGNTLSFSASKEDTKTTFDAGKLKWEVGDQIALCDGNNDPIIVTLQEDNIEKGGDVAHFWVDENRFDKNQLSYYAVFPASVANISSANSFYDDSSFSFLNYGKEQSSDNTFYSAAIGKRKSTKETVHLSFKNAASILHFEINPDDANHTNAKDIMYAKMTTSSTNPLASNFSFVYESSSITQGTGTVSREIWCKRIEKDGVYHFNIAVESVSYNQGFVVECYKEDKTTRVFRFNRSGTPAAVFSLGKYSTITIYGRTDGKLVWE